MPTLEKENEYKDEHFDFMQYHLRKFCLECRGHFRFSLHIRQHIRCLNLFRWCCIILHICQGKEEYRQVI